MRKVKRIPINTTNLRSSQLFFWTIAITFAGRRVRAQNLMFKIHKVVPAPLLVGVELNPGPFSGIHLEEEQKWEIVFLKKRKVKQTEIARQVGTSPQSVSKVLKIYRETGSVHERPGRGRKRKLSTADTKGVVKRAKRGKFAPEIARTIGNKAGVRTIQRTLKQSGGRYLPKKKRQKLSPAHEAKRLQYSREMENYDWKKVLFSDEKSFWLGPGRTYAWQWPGERKTLEVSPHPKKLHVWGAIGHYVKCKLYFFEQIMDQYLYQDIIKARLPENQLTYSPDCPKKIRKKHVFLQDNDPKHKAKKSMVEVRKLVGTRLIQHPSLSPDLNPMEDMWSYLNRKVQDSKVKTIAGLKKVLTRHWDALPWDEIRKSVTSMPRRLEQCRSRNGKRTDY